MSLPVKLSDVVHEMQLGGDFVTVYINLHTGELVPLTEEAMRHVDEEDADELQQWQLDEIRLASKVIESDEFVELPKARDVANRSLMEAFAGSLADESPRQRILEAVAGRGPMSRLQHLIDHLGLHEQWLVFRNAAFEEAATEFLTEREIPFSRE